MLLTEKKLTERVGRTFVRKLLQHHVTIGGQQFSKDDLVRRARTGNFAAAKRLERALDKMQVTDIDNVDPVKLAQIRGVGEATIYVLLCIQFITSHGKHYSEFNGTTWRTFIKNSRNGKKAKDNK